jgi:hypothetical protein
MAKENVVYTQNGVLFSYKEEWNYVICRKVEGLEIMLSKINHIQKDKHLMFSFICDV